MSRCGRQTVGERHDGGEDHGGGAHHGGADQHRLGGRLEGVARAVVLFQVLLGLLEVRLEAEVLLDLGFDAGQRLDGGKLVDRLRVVGDRAVAIHRDGHRTHAEEAEGHQAEGEDRRRHHQAGQAQGADHVGDAHQASMAKPSQ